MIACLPTSRIGTNLNLGGMRTPPPSLPLKGEEPDPNRVLRLTLPALALRHDAVGLIAWETMPLR